MSTRTIVGRQPSDLFFIYVFPNVKIELEAAAANFRSLLLLAFWQQSLSDWLSRFSIRSGQRVQTQVMHIVCSLELLHGAPFPLSISLASHFFLSTVGEELRNIA